MRTILRRGAVAALLLAGLGCSDSTSPVAIDPVGTWSGTTSQGRAISFTVTAAGVTGGALSYLVVGTGCTVDASVTIGGSAAAPVQNNQFTAVIDLSGSLGVIYTINGTFTSNTNAGGTLNVNDLDCNGTLNTSWTATKA